MMLVEEIYRATGSFPRYEQFGLTSQMRVGFLAPNEYDRIQAIVEEVGRMLNGLISSMQPPDEIAR